MESARPTSASASKSRRGWSGFGATRSTGISRRPVSSRPPVERIAARPRPIPGVPLVPVFASATSGDLLSELQIGDRAGRARSVAGDRDTVARRLADADGTGDDRIEDQIGETVPQERKSGG